jgi:hypothetical protein
LKKPSPTVNKAVRKEGKLSIVAAGTKKKEPNAVSRRKCFFVSNFCKTSTFSDTKKKIIDPKGYKRPKLLVEIELVIK